MHTHTHTHTHTRTTGISANATPNWMMHVDGFTGERLKMLMATLTALPAVMRDCTNKHTKEAERY